MRRYRPMRLHWCAECRCEVLTQPVRGVCHTCYCWRQRHGWDAVRVVRRACGACGLAWGPTVQHHARGLCARCYVQQWRVMGEGAQ